MKPPAQDRLQSRDIAGPGDHPYAVKFHREVAKVAARFGADSTVFRPTIAELKASLEIDPKQYPKKRGELKDARAAALTFRGGAAWRAVFTITEQTRTVRVLALEPHDDAYRNAKRR
jgi:mRNA-degrading endonuclease RelE of RelBE toxin-antitoxin system